MAITVTRRCFVRGTALFMGLMGSMELAGCAASAREASSSVSASDGQETAAADEVEEMAAINEGSVAKKSEYEEQIKPYRQDFPLGQTASLANIDADIVITNPNNGEKVTSKLADYVPWDGAIEVSVDAAAVYGSIDEAMRENQLGQLTDSRSVVSGDEKIVVVQATVTNVDAVSHGQDGYFSVLFLAPSYTPVASETSETISASLIAFDGAPAEASTNAALVSKFALEQGQTRVFTTAWRLVLEADLSTLCIRPSLTLEKPGPVKFLLDLDGGDESAV